MSDDIKMGSIDVEISSSIGSVESAIDKLVNGLTRVNKSLSSVDSMGLKVFSSSMKDLSTAMEGLSAKTISSTKVTNHIKKFEQIDASKIKQVAESIKPLSDSIATMSNIAFNDGSVTNFVNAMTRLSGANLSAINTSSMEELGNGISRLTQSLTSASAVPQNIISLVNALGRLAQGSQYIDTASKGLPNLAVALQSFLVKTREMGEVNSNITNFVLALGQLASAGAKTATTAVNLEKLGIALKSLLTTLKDAPSVSQNTLQMTTALAQLATQSQGVASGIRTLSSNSGGLTSLSSSFTSTGRSAKSLAFYFGKLYTNFWLLIRGFRLIGSAMDLSSQLTEVENVVHQTFQNATTDVEDFVSNSIKELGMSELSAKQFASRYQAMGTAMGIDNSSISQANNFLSDKVADTYKNTSDSIADMSLNLTRLTADMASFYDVEQSVVAEDLQAIYTGMTRPLRQYGLDLTQATLQEWALRNGINANIDSMTQAEKTLLRYQYVMANTAVVQGDFARTSDRLRVA